MTRNYRLYIDGVRNFDDLKKIPPSDLIEAARETLIGARVRGNDVLEATQEIREAFSFLYRCYIGELYKGGGNVLNKDIISETDSWLNQLFKIAKDSNPTYSEILNITGFAGNYRRDFEHYMNADILRYYPEATDAQIANSLYFIPLVEGFNPQNSTYNLPSYLTLSGGNTSFVQLNGKTAHKLEDFSSLPNLVMPVLEEFDKIRSAIGGSALTNSFF